MKGLSKFLITLIIGLALLLVLLQRAGWARFLEALALFLTWQGGLIVVLTLLFGLVSAIRWRFILAEQGNEFSLPKIFKLWLASMSLSYLTPVAFWGGEAVRVVGLKKSKSSSNQELSWQESIVSVGADKIFDGTAFLFFLLVGISVFAIFADFSSKIYLVITWFCLALLSSGILLFYFKRKEGPLKWFLTKILKFKQLRNSRNSHVVFEIEQAIGKFFSFKRTIFWQGLGLSFLKYGLSLLRVIFLFYFLTGYFHFLKGLAVFGFYNLSLFFPMPAALGSLEGAGVLVFSSLGYDLGRGVIFAFLCRGADLILAAVGLVFLIKIGFNVAGEKIVKWIERFSISNQKDEHQG